MDQQLDLMSIDPSKAPPTSIWIGVKSRPSHNNMAVLDLAVSSLMLDVTNWLKSSGEKDAESDNNQKEIRNQLREMLSLHGSEDGYHLAKYLESDGWCPDSELVDILDGASSRLYHTHDECQRDWVKANNIQPAFKVGDKITFKFQWKPEQTEYIWKIDVERGLYLTNAADINVLDRDCRERNGRSLLHVPYELAKI